MARAVGLVAVTPGSLCWFSVAGELGCVLAPPRVIQSWTYVPVPAMPMVLWPGGCKRIVAPPSLCRLCWSPEGVKK